jgi:C4-dicarboxylate-specific signal transduction histidine kinase
VACPLRTLRWEPALGSVFATGQLRQVREVLETRQPRHYQLDVDRIDPELYKMITRETKSLLIVPIRIAAENAGVLIFGEERRSDRAAFTNDSIQLAVAISRQVAVAVNLSWCYERLIMAQHNLRTAHDTVIKAERLSALGEVTRAVEHEVNNPLNVILNWSDVYREDPALDPDIRKSFQAIYTMAIRIGDVVKKLSALKEMKAVNLPDGNKMTDLSSSAE